MYEDTLNKSRDIRLMCSMEEPRKSEILSKLQQEAAEIVNEDWKGQILPTMATEITERNQDIHNGMYLKVALTTHAMKRLWDRRPYALTVALGRSAMPITGHINGPTWPEKKARRLHYMLKMSIKKCHFAYDYHDPSTIYVYWRPFGLFVCKIRRKDDEVNWDKFNKQVLNPIDFHLTCITFVSKVPKWVDLGPSASPIREYQQILDKKSLHEWMLGLMCRKHMRTRYKNKHSRHSRLEQIKREATNLFETLKLVMQDDYFDVS